MFLPQHELLRRASVLLGVGAGSACAEACDGSSYGRKSGGQRTFPGRRAGSGGICGKNYQLEISTARMLKDLDLKNDEPAERIEKRLSQVEEGSRLILDEMQRQAVIESVR